MFIIVLVLGLFFEDCIGVGVVFEVVGVDFVGFIRYK